MTTAPFSKRTTAAFQVAILVLAPAVMLAGHASHPWIGSPRDPAFFERLAAAVSTDLTRWWVSHLSIAVGSGLLVLAFLAIRSFLREAGEERWSAVGFPFVILGSVLYALLPAMEFAPVGALVAGADVASVQAALVPWFVPILRASAVLFSLGILGFVIGIVRSRAFHPGTTWVVSGALALLAITRFFPVGAAQLYVGPAAGVVALWPLAYSLWHRQASARREPAAEPAPAADERMQAVLAAGAQRRLRET